jgi:dCTP deaminase
MSFWSGDTLKRKLDAGIVNPFDEKRIDCASYQLRVGDEIYVSPNAHSSEKSANTKRQLKVGEEFEIGPGQFAFIITKEWITMPAKAMAFFSMRSVYKLQGLVSISGFHVDPGYRGYLVVSVINLGPKAVVLKQGEPCFLLFFADLDEESKIHIKKEDGYTDISLKVLGHVRGEMQSLDSLRKEVEAFEERLATAEPKVENFRDYIRITIGILTVIAIQLGILLANKLTQLPQTPPVQVIIPSQPGTPATAQQQTP